MLPRLALPADIPGPSPILFPRLGSAGESRPSASDKSTTSRGMLDARSHQWLSDAADRKSTRLNISHPRCSSNTSRSQSHVASRVHRRTSSTATHHSLVHSHCPCLRETYFLSPVRCYISSSKCTQCDHGMTALVTVSLIQQHWIKPSRR